MRSFALLLAGVVLITGSPVASADMDTDVFMKLSKGSKLEKHSVEMYIGGVAIGYLNANGLLSAKKQAELFCYDGVIDTKKAHDLTLQAIKESKRTDTVEVLLLMKLRRLYPC